MTIVKVIGALVIYILLKNEWKLREFNFYNLLFHFYDFNINWYIISNRLI